MSQFADYGQRRAVVIVPDESTYNERLASVNDEANKENLNIAINNMKANFSLPKMIENLYDSIEYAYLSEEQSRALVAKYNEEGASTRLSLIISKRRTIEKSSLTNEQLMSAGFNVNNSLKPTTNTFRNLSLIHISQGIVR